MNRYMISHLNGAVDQDGKTVRADFSIWYCHPIGRPSEAVPGSIGKRWQALRSCRQMNKADEIKGGLL